MNCESRLLAIMALPGNSKCADCGAPDPKWTSYQLGIFICVNCCGIHRNLHNISKVKSVTLDRWNDEQVQFMREHGNLKAKEIYEAIVPPFYYKPQPTDCEVLKEQWIRAKYERKEFTADQDYFPVCGQSGGCHDLHDGDTTSGDSFTPVLCADRVASSFIPTRLSGPGAWSLLQRFCFFGKKEGFLWKRGKDKKQFRQRYFVLSEEGVLKYYMTANCQNPKAEINVRDLNAIFQPERIGNTNGLALIFVKDGQTRTIFVYHDQAEEIVHWYNFIRAARLRYLKTAFPTATESELIPKITRNFVKEGYMQKTGQTLKEPFRKRWFTLDSIERKLLYYKCPMDAFETGGVFIGSKADGYKVMDSFPKGLKQRSWSAGISITTPERTFVCACQNKAEQTEWIEALNKIISRPMTPQDYATEASIRQNQRSSRRR